MKPNTISWRPWQHRGRCSRCATKVAACRRLSRCSCGGRIVY